MQFAAGINMCCLNRVHVAWIALFAVATCTGSGCKSESAITQAKDPPKVICAAAPTKKITDFDEFVGRTEESEVVEVRSRLSGFLRTAEFVDGAFVKQVIFWRRSSPMSIRRFTTSH